MAVIRDVMPAFELFQPAIDRRCAGRCSIATAATPGCLAGGLDTSTG